MIYDRSWYNRAGVEHVMEFCTEKEYINVPALRPIPETKSIEKIIKLLPSDFKNGMGNWSGRIEQHIADTNYGLLIWDLINKK